MSLTEPVYSLEKSLSKLPIEDKIYAYNWLKDKYHESLEKSVLGSHKVEILVRNNMIATSDDFIELFSNNDIAVSSKGARFIIQLYMYGVFSRNPLQPFDHIDRGFLRYAYSGTLPRSRKAIVG